MCTPHFSSAEMYQEDFHWQSPMPGPFVCVKCHSFFTATGYLKYYHQLHFFFCTTSQRFRWGRRVLQSNTFGGKHCQLYEMPTRGGLLRAEVPKGSQESRVEQILLQSSSDPGSLRNMQFLIVSLPAKVSNIAVTRL